MSVEALLWATKQIIPAQPKLVLLMLADWYNELEASSWPTHDQLAEKCGMSRRSVQRHIEWLVEVGLVIKEKRVIRGRQVSNKYRLPVNVLVFQGGQIDAPRGVRLTQPGGQIDAPSNTVKDTVKDTVKGAAKPQEDDLKVQDVLAGQDKMEPDEIVERAKRDSAGNFTPAALAYIWKHSRRSAADDNGFQAEILKKEIGQLKIAYSRVGNYYPIIVWNVMSDWIGFTKHAEKTAGAFNSPKRPQIAYFVKFIEAAADFVSEADQELDEDWEVQSIAKPLTKQTETSKTESNAITPEELAKLSEEMF